MKSAIFHPKAKEEIREFPEEVRRELGKAIFELQKGINIGMPLSKPIPSVAIGVEELRIKDRSGIYRTMYYKKHKDGILILSGFMKKTQKTPQQEIELAQKRLKELLNEKK